MWLGDVPALAPCAVLGDVPSAAPWALLGAGAVTVLGDNVGCPPPNHSGFSSAMSPMPQDQCWVFAPVLGALWDGSLVPCPSVKAQRPVELLIPTAHTCLESLVLWGRW